MKELYFTYGPMGSQKTVNLLATAHNLEEHGNRILTAKPSIDTKGNMRLVSRMGIDRVVDFLITPEMDVEAEVLRRRAKIDRINTLLIDEAQFLKPRQVDELLRLAVCHSVKVMTWGLRTDYRTHAFPGSQRLMETAHVLRETSATCGHGGGCEHDAAFNARLVNGRFVTEGGQVAIDGEAEVTYTALCAGHYMEDVGPITAETTK